MQGEICIFDYRVWRYVGLLSNKGLMERGGTHVTPSSVAVMSASLVSLVDEHFLKENNSCMKKSVDHLE